MVDWQDRDIHPDPAQKHAWVMPRQAVDREAVRQVLAKAGLTVQRKNASKAPEDRHIILEDATDGVKVSVGPDGLDTSQVSYMASTASMVLQGSGFKISCLDWRTSVVIGRDA